MVKTKSTLQDYTDQELRDELKRRADLEREKRGLSKFRCRDCRFCGDGLCYRHQVIKTAVCFNKPKPSQGDGRYYAARHSDKACENFEKK